MAKLLKVACAFVSFFVAGGVISPSSAADNPPRRVIPRENAGLQLTPKGAIFNLISREEFNARFEGIPFDAHQQQLVNTMEDATEDLAEEDEGCPCGIPVPDTVTSLPTN